MTTVGIDVGSITTKVAVMRDGEILCVKVGFTGYNIREAGRRIYDEALIEVEVDPSEIRGTIATGYGRRAVPFAEKAVTEITCHAAGAHFLNPRIRGVIDIGGQDSKAISLDEKGNVKDFSMNDKCAAGTGRFLEVMARALEIDLADFGKMSLDAKRPAVISSLCTVFAESEVISLISVGEERCNIIAGIHEAIGARVGAMAKRIGLNPPVMMTGGVAKNAGVVKALEKKLGVPLEVNPSAQLTGAIGAALIAGR